MTTTPLEQALTSYTRYREDTENRQSQVDDAVALAETGVFSIANIIAITGLPSNFAYELLKDTNPSKEGGRFNPEALHLLYDLRLLWIRAKAADPHGLRRIGGMDSLIRQIVAIGCSQRMIAKLCGIPKTTVGVYAKKA